MFRIYRQAAAPALRVSLRYFTATKLPCKTNRTRVRDGYANASGPRVQSCGAFRAYSTGKEVEKTPDPQTSGTASESSETPSIRHRQPSNMERQIFVWTGKYKTVEEVPTFVSEAALTSAKSKFRIYINLLMGVVTLLAAVAMIVVGRSRARRGESLSGLNIQRHPEMYGKMNAQEDAKK